MSKVLTILNPKHAVVATNGKASEGPPSKPDLSDFRITDVNVVGIPEQFVATSEQRADLTFLTDYSPIFPLSGSTLLSKIPDFLPDTPTKTGLQSSVSIPALSLTPSIAPTTDQSNPRKNTERSSSTGRSSASSPPTTQSTQPVSSSSMAVFFNKLSFSSKKVPTNTPSTKSDEINAKSRVTCIGMYRSKTLMSVFSQQLHPKERKSLEIRRSTSRMSSAFLPCQICAHETQSLHPCGIFCSD